MKINGNQKISSNYYIGLDVGTSSIGWAVTDPEYNIPKFKGNAMWGARLFEEAVTAAERRQYRVSRRLGKRKHQRLEWLELLFDEEISKTDPTFFMRLKDSSLSLEDKTHKLKYPLFNDNNYTDKDYYRDYPTAYHLRKKLIESQEPHDIRLVYLALHHILKSRGHFLFDMEVSGEYKTVDVLLDEFIEQIIDEYDSEVVFKDKELFIATMINRDLGITAKKKALRESVEIKGETDQLNLTAAIDMLAGATVKFSDLFYDESLKQAEKKSLTLNSDISADLDVIEEVLGESRLNTVLVLKEIFDSAKLAQMLGNHQYICEAKVEQYDVNKSDLSRLKSYVRENAPQKYKEIFTLKKDKLNNFAAYSGNTLNSGEYSCKIEDFCKYLLKALPAMANDSQFEDIYLKIKNNNFLPKLKGSDNSVIPHQLHLKELVKILDNAENYIDVLSKTDENGISVKDKIISIFSFKIPYYVGPLNSKSSNAWVVRTNEKIYPWNFEKVVDIQKSSQKFILNLISKCKYTGDYVLPKESLLFSEYCVLNEINPLTVNGEKISVEIKKEIYNELFLKSSQKVTKKAIKNFLVRKGYIQNEDEVSGVDDIIKSKLKSYHSFSKIMSVEDNYDAIEDVIRSVTIFGEDKKLLKSWLSSNYPMLEKKQVDSICRLKYKDWGSLSKTLLTEIYTPDENGEAHSVIDMLRNTNNNLMQLLSNTYMFSKNLEAYRNEKYDKKETVGEMIKDMYVSPSVKRSLMQTVKIVDEIVDIKKSAPKKIFIEVARDRSNDNAKKRTVTRKERLLELYKSCKKEYADLYKSLSETDEGALRKDALYLYYTQFGKCMYSGQTIELEKLNSDYDIDHIFPQSRIKDDSLDNRVLVARKFNEEKGNVYPIKQEIRDKMQPFWHMLKEKEFISSKKYERLVRHLPLTDEELSSFVARQLVETRQSTKALATVLTEIYKEAGTKIVYSKAGNVSDFRRDFDLIKCRDVNDLHHAKDAYLNIVVGNVYDTKFTQDFFLNIQNEQYSLNKVFAFDVVGAWDKVRSIGKVKAVMQKNNILVTRKPYETKGALYDLQIMPAGKGQLPIKEGKPIEKYGGYNKVKGAYFCVVEHDAKKGRVRTVEPVYIYKKSLYESNPVAYCTEILDLKERRIIYPKLLTDSPIEIDGKRVFICGRSGNALVCKHDYQFCVSFEEEKYIKAISKYVSKSAEEKAEEGVDLAPNSIISKEGNLELYELFLKKLQTPVYSRLFASIYTKLDSKVETFTGLSLINQCKVLLEILKLFKCNRQTSDLSLIGEGSQSGVLSINKSLASIKSAVAINNSVTGLYQYRTDLLK